MVNFIEWITTKSSSTSLLYEAASSLNLLFSIFIITLCIFEFRNILSFELKVIFFPTGALMVVYLISTFIALFNVIFQYTLLYYVYIALIALYIGIGIYRGTQLSMNPTYKKSP